MEQFWKGVASFPIGAVLERGACFPSDDKTSDSAVPELNQCSKALLMVCRGSAVASSTIWPSAGILRGIALNGGCWPCTEEWSCAIFLHYSSVTTFAEIGQQQ